jgi:hypothetical protein
MGDRHSREPERRWERDDKGRLYRMEADARVFKTIEDRDEALEEIYTGRPCPKDCHRSILAGVSSHRDELVAQCMAWAERRGVAEVHDSETLAEWERGRFGARLYLAAHCVLMHAVKLARFGERRPAKAESRTIPGSRFLDSAKRGSEA